MVWTILSSETFTLVVSQRKFVQYIWCDFSTILINFTINIRTHIFHLISGNGELLKVTLLLSEECRGAAGVLPKSRGPTGKAELAANQVTGVVLATATATVQVDFSASEVPQRPDTPQNDDIMRGGGNKGPLSDLHDILIGTYWHVLYQWQLPYFVQSFFYVGVLLSLTSFYITN